MVKEYLMLSFYFGFEENWLEVKIIIYKDREW